MIIFGIIYKNFYLCKMDFKANIIEPSLQEQILWRAVRNKLHTEENDSAWRVTYGPLLESTDINILEKRIIKINHIDIEVLTYKTYKRGYLHNFYFVCEKSRINDGTKGLVKFNIYAPYDYIDDEIDFFTLNGIERRTLKLKNLKKRFDERQTL